MTTLNMSASTLLTAAEALADLSANRLPIALSVKVSRMNAAVAEFHGALMKCLSPIIAEHTDGGDTIGPDHKNHAAFLIDAAPHFDEVIEVEIEPVTLEALEAVDGLKVTPTNVGILRTLGFIT